MNKIRAVFFDVGETLVDETSLWTATADNAGIPRFTLFAVFASVIAYVGDRLDNDVLPAVEAGMFGVFIRRGPWGVLHSLRPEVERASARIESLDELADLLR